MKKMRIKRLLHTMLWLFLWCVLPCVGMAAEREFVVVIDAGHGGKDPGAIGKKAREKNINLNVALALGELIDANCPGVRVVYTRKTDVFVSLDRRARIANEAKADLFISIHTNALPKGKIARGAETYTLGMARADENLEVAKRENSVILVEENYEEQYAGFNPNSAESYIMFEFMQDKYMKQSVSFASLIQRQFKSHAKRVDKGVHQAGFLVLRATSMPSVLVELGYISTPDEETYLSSKAGVAALSRSIYNAFVAYWKEGGAHSVAAAPRQTPPPAKEESTPPAKPEKPVEQKPAKQPAKPTKPVFKVQILTSSTLLKAGNSKLKGLKAEHYVEGGVYKYTYGSTTDYNEALRLRKQVSAKFKDAFIIAFRDGQKMNVQEAIREFKQRGK